MMQNCSALAIESSIPKDNIISVFCHQKSAFQIDINKLNLVRNSLGVIYRPESKWLLFLSLQEE